MILLQSTCFLTISITRWWLRGLHPPPMKMVYSPSGLFTTYGSLSGTLTPPSTHVTRVLFLKGIPSTCGFSDNLHSEHLVFGGTDCGSVLIWDLSSPHGGGEGKGRRENQFPCYSTDGLPKQSSNSRWTIHCAPIVRIIPISTGVVTNQLLSCDEAGRVILWVGDCLDCGINF